MSKNDLGIDPKKFKHLKSDEHSTTLQHKDGHKLTIMHSILSKPMQEQLKALSNIGKENQTESQKQEAEDKSQYGKITQKYQAGGSVEAPKEFLGQPVYGTGTSPKDTPTMRDPKPKPAYQSEENEWPLPSQTSVGKDIAAKKAAEPQEEACGGMIKKMADGGEPTMPPIGSQDAPVERAPAAIPDQAPAAPDQQATPQVPKAQTEVQKIYNTLVGQGQVSPFNPGASQNVMAFGPNGEPPQSFDSNVWKSAEMQAQKMQVDAAGANEVKAQKVNEDNEVRQRAGLPPIAVPGVNQPNGIPTDAQPPPTQPQADSMTTPTASTQHTAMPAVDGAEGMMASGYQSKLKGIEQEAETKGQLGQEQANIAEENLKAQQNAQATYKQHYDALDAERQNHIKDIQAGYIDPNQYWTGDPKTGKGGHSKLLAAIGMIIGGFDPAGHGNAGVKMLKYQMDQNIQAQMTNLGVKQNLLTANMKQFGNMKDATDMTRLMQSDIIQTELAKAAATAQTPAAKAAALQAAGQLKMEAAPLFQQFAMRRAMLASANGGGDPKSIEHMISYMRVMNPEMAKEMESRYVPGVGMASVPIPGEVRQELVAGSNFNKLAQQYLQFAKKNSGNMNPATIAQGTAMAAELQGLYRQKSKGGVFKEGEQQFIEKLIPSNPTQFVASMRTLPKLEQLVQSNQMQLNGTMKSYGLQNQGMQQPAQQDPGAALKWAVANPKDPRAKKIKQLLGHK